MKNRSTGFTMIELIVVIVILGVLAATALPKFINMRGDAEQAASDGVAGAATSAMNLNFSGCSLTNHVVTANKCVQVSACSQVGSLLQGGLAAAYVAAPNAVGVDIGTTDGNAVVCKVTKTVGGAIYTSTFTGVAAGN